MTARSTLLPNAWRRLLLAALVLPELTRRRERQRPQAEAGSPAGGEADEARSRRLLAAVPPLFLWRP